MTTALEIYAMYPRRVARRAALVAIERAMKQEDPAWLLERTRLFAESPAGHRGRFTPHPSTWFNQERYHDDENDWFMDEVPEARPAPRVPPTINMEEWRRERGMEA